MTSGLDNVNPEHGVDDNSLLTASGVVAGGTFLSRIFGLARDVAIAAAFGASTAADAFFVAFKIPNYFRRLFAEGAFSQGFVPVLSEYYQQRDHDQVRKLIARVSGTLGATLLALALLVVFSAPWVVRLFAPGFSADPERLRLAGEMLRLTFFYLPLISLTALYSAVLNVSGHFAIPALAPIWLNLCLIAAAWLAPGLAEPVYALAWAVPIAGLGQWLLQFPPLARRGLLTMPRPARQDPGVRRVLRLMLPAMFGASIGQLNVMIDLLLASFLVTGSISWLYYSDRLVEFPLGVFGVAIATVILPSLSGDYVAKNPAAFSRKLNWAMHLVVLIGAPAALALAQIAEPLLATLFFHGATTTEDIRMAARSLAAYALGLPGFMLVKVLLPGYFARQDTKTPVRIAVQAILVNVALNLILIHWLAHAGLALATSISILANAAMLLYGLWRTGIYQPTADWGLFLLRLLPGLAAMSLTLWWFSSWVGDWFALGILPRVAWTLALCALGASIYFATITLAGLRFWHLARRP